MKKVIKNIIKIINNKLINFLSFFNLGNFLLNSFISSCLKRDILINHKDVEFKLSVPNGLCFWRAKTFSTKEPETLNWIDSFEKNSILWDIGCNIGLYSVYAAKKNHLVYGFEPSFFNLEVLARNININNLSEKISILPIALNDTNKMSKLRLTSDVWGSAHSTFDKNYTGDGSIINEEITYQTVGFSMDDLVKILNLPYPDNIKIDVDGIEHLILKGGKKILSNAKSVLVENSNNFFEQTEGTKNILKETGFKISDEVKIDTNFTNQIWKK